MSATVFPQTAASSLPSVPPVAGAVTTDPLPEALNLAERLLREAVEGQTSAERRHGAGMARLVEDAPGKQFTVRLADEVFRSRRAAATAGRMRRLAQNTGIPAWLGPVQRGMLRLGLWASEYFPALVMPAVERQLRADSSGVILPGEPDKLGRYLAKRRAGGTRVNVNQLGEAILGEEEAAHRLASILGHLENPAVDYISVKISAIFSQIHLTDWNGTVAAVKDRLRLLYRAAMANPAPGPDGKPQPKFVNLDMEEYRDLDLTVQAFREILDEPEFSKLYAGIVLQAYLPDSWPILQSLTEWSRRRQTAHGSRIKVRLVKGANLAMERVEAELHGWEAAPFGSKHEVDANFKRMLEFALRPENSAAVQLGVGSHNLFDIALALTLARTNGTAAALELEMLEGMANHQARAVQDEAGGLLVYAPVVKRQDFGSAMAYLVRRLDENTAPDNFLRDLFGITPGSPDWKKQQRRFLAAWEARHDITGSARRPQNRLTETEEDHAAHGARPFDNVSDTDWTLPVNRGWADKIRQEWTSFRIDPPLPLGIGGELRHPNDDGEIRDPSIPGKLLGRHALAGAAEVDAALSTAVTGGAGWAAFSTTERGAVLRRCAVKISARRADLIGAMMAECAKAVTEADVEISEAIDFANYYAGAFDEAGGQLDGVKTEPLGVVVVTPPWNFPFAIPCGGVLAALMAGNAVILKPAPEAVLTGWLLAECLWEAGVPRDALQFLPCPDNEIGRALLTDPRTAAVILTGAWETARLFQSWKPEMKLFAETSGKNGLIVTAQADRDLAVKDLVRSAFGHAGQKCSAASLGILEAEVYDDPAFRRQLRDAAASLRTGSAWDPASIVTPLIREPGEALHRALTTLDPGEEWLLEPRCQGGNPNLWSPGIKLGVRPGSWFHRTECFGPVLGLMRAENLEDAIRIQNDSSFGLTAGLHSLDEREIALWRDRVEAGNGYINRPITGAIVRRQPFGGWKRSSIGPGAKAGGPNYVFSLCRWSAGSVGSVPAEQSSLSVEVKNGRMDETVIAADDFAQAWNEVFSKDADPSGLACESNVLRYRPTTGVVIRLNGPENLAAARLAAKAAATCGTRLEISTAVPLETAGNSIADFLTKAGIIITVESESTLAARLPELSRQRKADTLRTLGEVPAGGESGTAHRPEARAPGQKSGPSGALLNATFEAGFRWIDAPVLPRARLELPRWLREQSLTETMHRYGNPIVRNSV
ncbi:MAG: bifunctional proline dehydrogenase/L-glutamate gamma-semialdehyde dehydrogenase [Verrucomicrobiota bacterium]